MFKIDVPEMTVKLPSAGLLNVPAEVKLRAITGKEELKMSSTHISKYIDLVINACVTSLDESRPFDFNELTAVDKIYLFIMLRSLSYGDSMNVDYSCQSCKTPNTAHIQLSELPVEYLTDEAVDNLTVELPISKFIIKLRHLTDSRLNELELEARRKSLTSKRSFNEERELLISVERIESVTYDDDQKGITTEVNTPENRPIFQMLIEQLIGRDIAAIQNAWDKLNNYGVTPYIIHKCSNCGESTTIGVDLTSTEFFRPR